MQEIDTMTYTQVREVVCGGIESLKHQSPPLRFALVHEQTIAAQLAHELRSRLAGWNVDCEYNLDGDTQKRLLGIKACKSKKPTDIIKPDIVVHHRGSNGRENNLLVVEMKKAKKDDPCDILKLRLMTETVGQYRYQFGLYVHVDNGAFHQSWYENGHKLENIVIDE